MIDIFIEIVFKESDSKILLGLEIVIERTLRHLGSGQQLGQPDRGESLAQDHVAAGVEHMLAGIGLSVHGADIVSNRPVV
ncbi:MAG: hypothetical protein ACR2PF_04650 [Rhizobiaceae bacterium]